MLTEFSEAQKSFVMSRHIASWVQYQKQLNSKVHRDKLTEDAIKWFESKWSDPDWSFSLIPGKDAISFINGTIQRQCTVSIAPSSIISSMTYDEVPKEMIELIESIAGFLQA